MSKATRAALLISIAPLGLLAQPLPEGWPLGARIPAISGRVVDAITGAAIPNLDVTLRATSAAASFGSGRDTLRYENARTTPAGRFSFRTSLQPEITGPLIEIERYWLSVNLTFWSIPWMNAQPPQQEHKSDPIGSDLSPQISQDPLAQALVTSVFQLRMAGPRVNYRAYFPMAVRFLQPCDQRWNANCLRFDETAGVRIPLIPILNSPEACSRILDESLREQCRQLNAYADAFRRRDAALCDLVDQGPGAKACAESIVFYLRNPRRFTR
jgi:hypothetical protein